MALNKGDVVKVISPFAPYHCREVVVADTFETGPWPIRCDVTIDGELFPVCYKEHELQLVDQEPATEEIPVVVA